MIFLSRFSLFFFFLKEELGFITTILKIKNAQFGFNSKSINFISKNGNISTIYR